ncbi:MAG: flippase-like domain-containing protein [Bdellovibrionales bacterium]|nr:flippase-like domain-containing protein [Bdellovibrionales bacterium]
MKPKFLIKLSISIGMLAMIMAFVDLESLKRTLLNIPTWTAVIVILGYLAGQILSAYKWWLIVRSGGIETNFSSTLKAYLIGMFVNCFGLGVLGGDMTRGILVSEGKGKKTSGIASVIADRAQGLGVLAVIGLIGAAYFHKEKIDSFFYLFLIALCSAIVVGWILGPAILLKFYPKHFKFRNKVEEIAKAFPKDPKVLITITLLSAIFHLIQIYLHKFMGAGLGIDLSWPLLLATVPFVNILSSLPISWNGLGVRETGYIFFLAGYLTQEQALSFGAIWLLAVTVTSAIGGIISFLAKDISI